MLKERTQTCKLPSCDNEVVQGDHSRGGRKKIYCSDKCGDIYNENRNNWTKLTWYTIECVTCGVWVSVTRPCRRTYCETPCKPKRRIRYDKNGMEINPSRKVPSMCECGNEKKPRAIECDRCASMPKVSDILGWSHD